MGTIKQVKLDKIFPYEKNQKKHPAKHIEQVAKSIKEFGFNQPIVVDKQGVIIVGHGRYEAAKALKLPTVPCLEVDLTDEQAKAYRLADNKLNESDWDMGLVIEELKGLSPEMLDLTGFDMELLLEPGDKEERIPPIPQNPQSKLGDVYEIGQHRIICGSSTDYDVVEKLMGGNRAKICFTSPPYWLGFEYEKESGLEDILEHIEKQSLVLSKFVDSKIIINTGNIAAITKAQKITGKKQVAFLIDWWKEALNKQDWLLRHIRIWAKAGQMRPSSRNDSVDMHWEYIETYTQEEGDAGFIANFYNNAQKFEGQHKLGGHASAWATSGIWTNIHGNARSDGHTAVFPVILPWRHLLMYTEKDDIVYEPYCGSGTTLIASEMLGRKCYGCELEPAYVDVIIQRYIDYVDNENIIKNGEPIIWKKSQKN